MNTRIARHAAEDAASRRRVVCHAGGVAGCAAAAVACAAGGAVGAGLLLTGSMLVWACLLCGAWRAHRRLPAAQVAQAVIEDTHTRGWTDACRLYEGLQAGSVLRAVPPGPVVLVEPGETMHARRWVVASVAGGPAQPVWVSLTSAAIVAEFGGGHIVRWWWQTATGLRIDLPQWRVELSFTECGESLHIAGPAAALIAVYAAERVRGREDLARADDLALLRVALPATADTDTDTAECGCLRGVGVGIVRTRGPRTRRAVRYPEHRGSRCFRRRTLRGNRRARATGGSRTPLPARGYGGAPPDKRR